IGVDYGEPSFGREEKILIFETHAAVVQISGHLASSGFSGKLAGVDGKPHQIGCLGIREKAAIIRCRHLLASSIAENIPVVAPLLRDAETKLGEQSSVHRAIAVIGKAPGIARKDRSEHRREGPCPHRAVRYDLE